MLLISGIVQSTNDRGIVCVVCVLPHTDGQCGVTAGVQSGLTTAQ